MSKILKAYKKFRSTNRYANDPESIFINGRIQGLKEAAKYVKIFEGADVSDLDKILKYIHVDDYINKITEK